tara:strand:+ start:1107 stop:1466 length:360 start_codon:yes stop_codon:yes gene_type:complete
MRKRRRIKKSYGEYKRLICPFCDRNATQNNEQGLDVCHLHTKSVMPEVKCTCGKWLELKVSKFGPYFNCIDCGNINYKKGMEIKEMTTVIEDKKVHVSEPVKEEKKVVTISSRDVDYFD